MSFDLQTILGIAVLIAIPIVWYTQVPPESDDIKAARKAYGKVPKAK